jgi:cell division protease FtsH
MFVGVGASRVRDMFDQAKKNAPCIIFIDEIDAVGGHRGASGMAGGQEERGQTLNALLVEMDGFDSDDNIIVLAATNRPDILDPALLRPGRFDRIINILPPDIKGREKILQVHTHRTKLDSSVDLEEVARSTPGFTGAELASLVNEAALIAGRQDKNAISQEDFEIAKDRILMGVERKGLVISEQDRRTMAVHEAGHAILARFLPESDPLHKITIIPRGRAMGHTQQMPLQDRHAYNRVYLTSQITTLMGGRAAEEVLLDQRSTGAEQDLQQAIAIAANMVGKWGMSEEVGPLAYFQVSGGFLGEEGASRSHSEHTARLIDDEIRKLLEDGYKAAKSILERETDFLVKLSDTLLEVETLDRDEMEIIYECTVRERAYREAEAKAEQ